MYTTCEKAKPCGFGVTCSSAGDSTGSSSGFCFTRGLPEKSAKPQSALKVDAILATTVVYDLDRGALMLSGLKRQRKRPTIGLD